MVAEKQIPTMKRLHDEEVVPALREQFGFKNPHQLPRLSKIVVNCGVGRFLENQKLKPDIRDTVMGTLTTITGQRPVMVMAKRSVSNFKVREGSPSGFMVTLRGDRMWNFLERFVHLAVPRIRDFRGLKRKSFDGAGNYSVGLTEQAVWPEINMANATFTHGMNINIIFENSDAEKSTFMLEKLGMPFTRLETTA